MHRIIASLAVFYTSAIISIAQAQISYVQPNYASEQPAEGPSTVFSAGGRIAVADTVVRMVRVFDSPALDDEIATLPFPPGLGLVVTMQAMGDVLTLIDGTGESWILKLPVAASFPTSPVLELVGERSSDDRVTLSLSNGELLGIIEPDAEGATILDWSLVGRVNDASIVLLNQIFNNDLKARVLQFQKDSIESLYTFSWAQFDYVVDRPLHFDSEGKLWIFALRDGIWAHPVADVMLWERRPQVGSSQPKFFEGSGNAEDSLQLEELAKRQRNILYDATQLQLPTDYEVVDEAMLTFADLAEFPLQAPSGIRRRDAVARALAYYTIPFFYRQRNYTDLGAGWQRPSNLQGRSGTWQRGVRYYWSGYMSLRRHQEGIIRGDVVGDINTDKIINQGVIGCDCSGCVSVWLGIPRHTTTGIANDPDDIFQEVSMSDLRPGDILNSRGSHVRMLVNKIEVSSGTNYRVIESSKSCGGVCIQIYTATQLGRYKPLTYKKFID